MQDFFSLSYSGDAKQYFFVFDHELKKSLNDIQGSSERLEDDFLKLVTSVNEAVLAVMNGDRGLLYGMENAVASFSETLKAIDKLKIQKPAKKSYLVLTILLYAALWRKNLENNMTKGKLT